MFATSTVLAFVAAFGAVGAFLLVRSKDVVFVVFALVFMVPTLAFAAYRKTARIYAGANVVAYRDALRRTRRCFRSEFRSIDLGPRGRLEFRKLDGSCAFSVPRVYWSKAQVKALSDFLGVRDVNSEEYMLEWLKRGMRPPKA